MGDQSLAVPNRATVASLPKWREPKGLEAAKEGIRILGRSMHQNAYLLGKTLLWSQEKVGDGNFEEWFNHSVKLFHLATGYRMMSYAKLCDRLGFLVEYHPGLARTMRAELPPLPPGKFRILYADPPWRYDFSPTESRSIEAHYPSLTVKQICQYRVEDRAVQDLFANPSVLFLWATKPKLREALLVIKKWGCEYRTNYVWVKQDNGKLQWGMGYWGRDAHELLLIAVKGNMPPPSPELRIPTVLIAPRTETHSEKPDVSYALIEAMFPDFGERERIELFARRPRNGWTPWGSDLVST